MSPAEHYDEAERLLDLVEQSQIERTLSGIAYHGVPDPTLVEYWARLALVHATLACRQL